MQLSYYRAVISNQTILLFYYINVILNKIRNRKLSDNVKQNNLVVGWLHYHF